MNNNQLKSQAKRAYEFARFKMASRYALLVLPLIALSCLTCGAEAFPFVIGAILLVAVISFKWRGLEYGKSVVPGLIAGSAAFSIPLVLHVLEICCRSNLEVTFCVLSGVFGGFILGRLVSNEREKRSKVLIFGLGIAGLTGALGCAAMGVGAVAGLFLALTVSSIAILRFAYK